jgi:hypothetical protein
MLTSTRTGLTRRPGIGNERGHEQRQQDDATRTPNVIGNAFI